MLLVKAFSDSTLIPRSIRTRWLTRVFLTHVIDFMISHIFREFNSFVDYLARYGVNSKTFTRFNDVHVNIYRDFLSDKLDVPKLIFYSSKRGFGLVPSLLC